LCFKQCGDSLGQARFGQGWLRVAMKVPTFIVRGDDAVDMTVRWWGVNDQMNR